MTQPSHQGLGAGPPRSGGGARLAVGVVAAVLSAFLLVAAILLAGTAGDSDPDPRPDATPSSPLATGDGPNTLDDLKRRCGGALKDVDTAIVRFDDQVSLEVGDQYRFTVSLSAPGAPSSVGPKQDGVGVKCHVQTRLSVGDGTVTISPAGWRELNYSPSEPTTWTWIVTGKEAGTAEATLEIFPVARLSVSEPEEEAIETNSYDVTFAVAGSASERASDVGRWLLAAGSTVGAVLAAIASYLTIRAQRRDQASVRGVTGAGH
ncbi:hypothetical protein F0U44_17100 [Nocardioides humilatus]|uniref:Uncharacterized protein n=1 Tax=Nocardioides humilatus TaxID=2607660 RepID=A0A5B1L9D9_9ACTN|nr:hypothetical protein [Nocardioides humilatus]KAA1416904.1 hypothetical protein F0U44_17100 [Nocardioides humilatus]